MISIYNQLNDLRQQFVNILALIPQDDWFSPSNVEVMRDVERLARLIDTLESITIILENKILSRASKKARILPYMLRLKRMGFSNKELQLEHFIQTFPTQR